MKPMFSDLIGYPVKAGWQKRVGLCLALLTGAVYAEDVPAVKSDAVPAAPAAQVLKTDKEKMSYALGLNVGMNVQKQIKRGSLDVDNAFFVQAINDALAGREPLLTVEQASTLLVAKRTEMRAEQEQVRKELGLKNQQEEEKFLAKNKAEEGVVTLESGLQYKVLKAGEGAKPKAEDTVRCAYKGTLLDGTEVDSTAKRGQPATLDMKQLIQGWREALELMPVGSKWQIVIPSKLAYGDRGAGPIIGPNAPLIFEVELVGINDPASKPSAALQPAEAGALAAVPQGNASQVPVSR